MKVAIVHDWLVGGGAEKVVLELHNMYPDAPIYTSYCTDEWRDKLEDKVVTGYLQRWPFSKVRKFIPVLRALWFSNINLSNYDLVISSSGAEAKFVKVGKNTKHIAYIHAPTHYYWDRYDQYIKYPGFGIFDPLARLGLKILVGPMRRWDYKTAQRPDKLISNSSHTQAKIKQYYERDSVVVHPPVDTKRFTASSAGRNGLVIAGRQTPYKRIDLAVTACTKLNLPLTVIGNGPDHNNLTKIAGPTIKFINNASDTELAEHFAIAEGFIFPNVDDFGLTPVEAMASGTPVIAFQGGGALDYIIEGKTGMFFDKPTAESLIEALKNFDGKSFDHILIKEHANKFSIEAFHKNIKKVIK